MPLPYTGVKCFNLISDKSYDLTNDVVLSVHYSLSGNINSQAGFSFFICQSAADQDLESGQGGIDLCYTGMSNAVAAFGIDTDGVFAQQQTGAQGTINSYDLILNSVAARPGVADEFALSALGSYVVALSSYGITVVQPDDTMRTLRYRVGNLGRTMYLDYRVNHDDDFLNIAQVDIGDRITLGEPYKVGVGYSSPFSGVEEAKPNVRIASIHIEGLEYTA